MKAYAVLAILAVLFCFAPSGAYCQSKLPADTYNFLLGIAVGLELEISPQTFNTCTADVNITVTDFDQGFQLIKTGIDHLSADDVEQGLQLFGAGVQEISLAFSACGVDTIVADVKTLGAELQQGVSGIIDIIVHEALNIFHHKTDITNAFKQVTSDWEAQNYYGAGQGVGEILGILLQE